MGGLAGGLADNGGLSGSGRSLRNLLVGGNSYALAAGGAVTAGASAVKHRYSLAVAQRFGAAEHNIAVNGAYMSYPHKGATGDGGYADILQGYVPSRTAAPYLAGIDAAIVSTGLNDLGLYGSGSLSPWIEATRRVLCRLRAAAVFEDTDASVAYGGTWTTNAGTLNNSGAGNHGTTTVGATATITVPADFPGGEIDLGFVIANGFVSAASVTVDSVAVPSAAISYASGFVTAGGTYLGIVKRLTGLAAGAHTIVVTTTTGNTFLAFDSWEIPASSPPVIAHPLQPRLATPGANTADSDIAILNTAIGALAAEFTDGRVINPDIDTPLAKTAAYFNASGDHPNDRGHQIIAGVVGASLGVALTPVSEMPAAAAPLWHNIGAVNEPAFTNSWVNAGTAGYETAGFRRSATGRVSLKGLIKTGAAASVPFTLPDGYRPASNIVVPIVINSGVGAFGNALIGSDGTVTPLNSGSTWTSLGGVSFDAA